MKKIRKCAVKNCEKNSKGGIYCTGHYQRIKRLGGVFPNKKLIEKRNGFHVDKDGYIVVKRQFQHRRVMAEFLKRPLLKSENVHHKNGDRSDNRIENLELWSTFQPRGQKISEKIKYALEIIKMYGKNPKKYE